MQVKENDRKGDSEDLLATADSQRPSRKAKVNRRLHSLCRDGHGQSTCFLVGSEADNVQTTRNDTVDQQGDGFGPGHLSGSVDPNSLQLSRVPAIRNTLDEGQGRHSHEQIEGMLYGGSARSRM